MNQNSDQNALTELENLLFKNPSIQAELIERICTDSTVGLNVFSTDFLEAHPQLKTTLLGMLDELSQKIPDLHNLLSMFPDSDFSIANLNIEEIRRLFADCRIVAKDIHELIGPIQKMALASADSTENAVISKLNLELPALVYQYPTWVADCNVLKEHALRILSRKISSLEETISKPPSNTLSIRMLRCLDPDDPLARADDFDVYISHDGFIDVTVSEGQFRIPAEDLRNIGPMVGYNASDFPLIYFAPIDNYAQMIAYELFHDTREYPWPLSNIGTSDDRFVVSDSSKVITIPSRFLSAANIPEHDNIVCRLVCSSSYLEIWEPDVMDNFLEDIDLSELFGN